MSVVRGGNWQAAISRSCCSGENRLIARFQGLEPFSSTDTNCVSLKLLGNPFSRLKVEGHGGTSHDSPEQTGSRVGICVKRSPYDGQPGMRKWEAVVWHKFEFPSPCPPVHPVLFFKDSVKLLLLGFCLLLPVAF